MNLLSHSSIFREGSKVNCDVTILSLPPSTSPLSSSSDCRQVWTTPTRPSSWRGLATLYLVEVLSPQLLLVRNTVCVCVCVCVRACTKPFIDHTFAQTHLNVHLSSFSPFFPPSLFSPSFPSTRGEVGTEGKECLPLPSVGRERKWEVNLRQRSHRQGTGQLAASGIKN